MEKQEFLDRLRLSMSGKVAPEVVDDTIEYYEEYINTQIRLGTDRNQVMEALGDPRLIARTIIETKGRNRANAEGSGDKEQEYGESREVRRRLTGIPGWVWLLVFFFVVGAVLLFIFRTLIKLAPLLIIVALIIYLARLHDDK
ncbi:MAG: DUF1700 domain-containing protein [Acetatifactor sp.]